MSYGVVQREQDFTIRASSLAALRIAVEANENHTWDSPSLDQWLTDRLFEPTYGSTGDLEGLQYVVEWSRNEDETMEMLAPSVEPGSWIEWQGEEGEIFRRIFDGRAVTMVEATLTFE